MYTQSNYAGAINDTLNGTVNIPGTCDIGSLTINGNTAATQS